MSDPEPSRKAPPKVTVLMYVRNSEAHLREAIQSILLQGFKDFEFLVINDGSTDASAGILDSLGDTRMRVMHQTYMGQAASLNRGMEHARGQNIALAGANDVSLRERLETQVRYLDENTGVALVCSRTRSIDSKSRPVPDWQLDWRNVAPEQIIATLPLQNCIAHSSVMIRTPVLRRFGYSSRAGTNLDYELWLRLVSGRQKLHKISEPLVVIRAAEVVVQGNLAARATALGWSLRHFRIGKFEFGVARNLLLEALKALQKLLGPRSKTDSP